MDKNNNTKNNRKYKDSVFVDLFGEDITANENAISLYNSLYDTNLTLNDTKIDKLTIDNVLYLNLKNDVSFKVGNNVLVLAEHQSTINYNMPLRNLMYIGRIYETVTDIQDRYKKNLVKVPYPAFYTFYNGIEDYPKEKVLKLSDAYMINNDKPMLELFVKVININVNKKHEILSKCDVLNQYSMFIDKVRQYRKTGQKNYMEVAIKECINSNILSEYLSRKGRDVMNMLTAEYDYEMDMRVNREEAMNIGRQQGRKEGLLEGRQKGLLEGKQKGLLEGRQEGLLEGKRKGLQEGRINGEAELVATIRRMSLKGLDVNAICDLTGIEQKKIEAVISCIKNGNLTNLEIATKIILSEL